MLLSLFGEGALRMGQLERFDRCNRVRAFCDRESALYLGKPFGLRVLPP